MPISLQRTTSVSSSDLLRRSLKGTGIPNFMINRFRGIKLLIQRLQPMLTAVLFPLKISGGA